MGEKMLSISWDDAIKHSFGLAGVASSFFLFASALPVLIEIRSRKSTLQYSFIPYLLEWVNSFSWLTYCFHRGLAAKFELAISSFGGFLMSALSLGIFRSNMMDSQKAMVFDAATITTTTATAVLAASSFTVVPCDHFATRWCWWKYWSICCNVVMYSGPILAMVWAWQNRSVDFIPMSFSLGSLVGAAPWCAYGLLAGDATILVPNLVGVVVGVCMFIEYQLIICRYHRTASLQVTEPTSDQPLRSELVVNPWKQALFTFFYMDPYVVVRQHQEIELSDLRTMVVGTRLIKPSAREVKVEGGNNKEEPRDDTRATGPLSREGVSQTDVA